MIVALGMSIPFSIYTKKKLLSYVQTRAGETKFGESVTCLEDGASIEALADNASKYVLIGIPEDFGVRANFGRPGAHTAFEWALKALLNTQSNSFFNPAHLLILGAFDFSATYVKHKDDNVEELRALVDIIDQSVSELVSKILSYNKIPIVIGGGHNNAYPLLKALSEDQHQAINVINIDAHSDFRALEGRHSGNGFSYAKSKQYLDQYVLWGLHQNYTSAYQFSALQSNACNINWYEDLLNLNETQQLDQLLTAIGTISNKKFGFELDVDAIAKVNSSAYAPIGFSANSVMNFIKTISAQENCAYFHICEGAYQIEGGPTDPSIGKLIAYYVLQFVKNHLNL